MGHSTELAEPVKRPSGSCSVSRVDSQSGEGPDGCPKGRVSEPWDILRGKCVFKHRAALDADLKRADLEHFAPNCATFSRAREIPIPNVSNVPKPLRDESNPTGIPSEVARMSNSPEHR